MYVHFSINKKKKRKGKNMIDLKSAWTLNNKIYRNLIKITFFFV